MLKINTIKSMFSKNTNKVAEVATKKLASVTEPVANSTRGAEALANQGRAMIKRPYQKPEATFLKLDQEKFVATSGKNMGAGGRRDANNLAKESTEWYEVWSDDVFEEQFPSSASPWD